MKKITLILFSILLFTSCEEYEGEIKVGDRFVDVDANPFDNDTILILDIRGNYIKYEHVSEWLHGEVRSFPDIHVRRRFNIKVEKDEKD